LFRSIYGLSISYDTAASGEWNILCEGDLSTVRADLEKYGIRCEGELRKSVEIDKIAADLVDDNFKRRFVAGLADTIASTKSSHRRFTDDKQIISFEISGFGYGFVCSLCKLLYSIKCYPDQILWNHPNMHCASDPHDKKWKKGFKLRVLADQYSDFGAFSFTSKVRAMQQNRKLEKEKNTAVTCETRKLRLPTPSCVHSDEHSNLLPLVIRGGHYVHNRHFCAVMGCEHAPYGQIYSFINNAENYINPFTVVTKGTATEIADIVKSNKLYSDRNYATHNLGISTLYNQYKSNANLLLFGNTTEGYPINEIIGAIEYLLAAKLGRLKGKRPIGGIDKNIEDYLSVEPTAAVKILVPELFTPIIISLGNYSALVGAYIPSICKKLISISPDNQYKILMRPITEDDLK